MNILLVHSKTHHFSTQLIALLEWDIYFVIKTGNLDDILNTSFLLTSAKPCQFSIQDISQMHPHFTIFITTTLVKESRKPSLACAICKSLLTTLSFFPSYDFHLFICFADKVSFQNMWNIPDYVTQLLKTLVRYQLFFSAELGFQGPALSASTWACSHFLASLLVIWTIICSLRTLCFLLVFLHFLPLPPILVHSDCYNKLHKPDEL